MKKYFVFIFIFLMGCESPKLEESEHPLVIIKMLPISADRFGNRYYYVKTFNGDEVIKYEVSETFYESHVEKDTIKNYIIE